ncbi:MAG: electron transport complex subunit E [Calditrichia bacterium]|nr:electron transport complex subunit E [Calditrichia bacterium]
MKNVWNEFSKGIVKEHPIFKMALGLCPALAVSTSIDNAVGMGAAVIFVLVMSNVIVSLLMSLFKKIFSEEKFADVKKIRIPMFIVIIATFVTMVEMTMQAYFPTLNEALGIFIPLIVVNCVILGRAEAYASKNNVMMSVIDGLGMGIGFTIGLVAIAGLRELLGTGGLFGMSFFGSGFKPALIFILSPGAFIVIGLYMALINWFETRKR